MPAADQSLGAVNVFGDLVRGVRESAGISLSTVAGELGFSVAYVSGVERGLRGPFRTSIVTRLALLRQGSLTCDRAA